MVQEVAAPGVIEIPSQSTWESTDPSAPVFPGNSEGTRIRGQRHGSASLEIMPGSFFERTALRSCTAVPSELPWTSLLLDSCTLVHFSWEN